MKSLILICTAGLLFSIGISNANADVTSPTCLSNTRTGSQCKDCCDGLDASGATRRNCRDSCSAHDFSQNVDFIVVNTPSRLGPNGNYSAALNTDNEQMCKEYCDNSEELTSGDRRFCRDACHAAGFRKPGPHSGQTEREIEREIEREQGLPREIVIACQGKKEGADCSAEQGFTGHCNTLQSQLACVLSQKEASAQMKLQWTDLDRNHDGFLDINEIKGHPKPEKR